MKKIFNSYNLLLDRKVEIEIDKKNYIIDFKAIHLYHLLGIQYLNDMKSIQKINKSKLLNKIGNGHIDYDLLEKSVYFEKIKSRLENFYFLPNFILSSTYIEYQSYKRVKPGTKMEFDYLLVHDCIKNSSSITCLGLRIEDESAKLIPVSYFVCNKEDINYMRRLEVFKINTSSK